MEKLTFGFSAVPDDALAAWGARAIINGYGHGVSLDVPPDRTSLVISKPGCGGMLLSELRKVDPIKLAEAALASGAVKPDEPVTLYMDMDVVVVGRMAGGYFYLAGYLRFVPGLVELPRKATGDIGTAAGGPVWLKLIRAVLASEDKDVFKLLDVGPGEDGIYREAYEEAEIVFPPQDESIVLVVPKTDRAIAAIRAALAKLKEEEAA